MKNLFESWRNFVNEQQYVVQSGDNLTKIAKSNNLTLQQLLDLNPQYKNNPNLIKVGQKIKLSQEDEDAGYDPEDILSELEYEVQELFSNYYSSGGGFKNNLRDCVAFRILLEQNKFDTPKRKRETEQTLVKTWYNSCLVPFVRDQINEKLKQGHFSSAMEGLGYDQRKFVKTLSDMSAATLKYVTDFTIQGGNIFDENKNLEEISDKLEKIKRKTKIEAKTYLNKPAPSDRFKQGAKMEDVLARFNTVRLGKS